MELVNYYYLFKQQQQQQQPKTQLSTDDEVLELN